jgi:hypothetical protein
VTTHYDPNVLNGWFKRPYDWEFITGIQHELRSRVSVNATFVRRWYRNFTTTDNQLQTSSDYDPFCVPVPDGLPNAGSQACGFYNVTPTKFSATTNNVVTFASHFGTQTEVYNGLDLTVNARTVRRLTVQGGLNAGRTALNNCYVVDSPQPTISGSSAFGTITGVSQSHCQLTTPFQPQFKALAAYALPWQGLQVSATVQSLPGPMILAQWAAPASMIAPSLGRNPSGNVATVTVQLIKPGTEYGDRLNQLDFRLTRIFRIDGARRLQVNLDLYNALNASPVVFQNNNYGSQWQRPTSILSGRLVKFGAQFNF